MSRGPPRNTTGNSVMAVMRQYLRDREGVLQAEIATRNEMLEEANYLRGDLEEYIYGAANALIPFTQAEYNRSLRMLEVLESRTVPAIREEIRTREREIQANRNLMNSFDSIIYGSGY